MRNGFLLPETLIALFLFALIASSTVSLCTNRLSFLNQLEKKALQTSKGFPNALKLLLSPPQRLRLDQPLPASDARIKLVEHELSNRSSLKEFLPHIKLAHLSYVDPEDQKAGEPLPLLMIAQEQGL